MKKPRLTPKLALAVSLLHMANLGGDMTSEKMMCMISTLQGDNRIISYANKYIKDSMLAGITLNEFLEEACKLLSDAQKEFIIINMIDIMLTDKECGLHEEKLLGFYLDAFGFEAEKYEQYKNFISKKNDFILFEE